jgi:lipocalin
MTTPMTETTKGDFDDENADSFKQKKSKEGDHEFKDMEKAKAYLRRVQFIFVICYFTNFPLFEILLQVKQALDSEPDAYHQFLYSLQEYQEKKSVEAFINSAKKLLCGQKELLRELNEWLPYNYVIYVTEG